MRSQLGDRLRDAVSLPFEATVPPPGLAAPSPLSCFDEPPPGLVPMPAKISIASMHQKLTAMPSKIALPDPEFVHSVTYDDFANDCTTPRTNGVLLGQQLGNMFLRELEL